MRRSKVKRQSTPIQKFAITLLVVLIVGGSLYAYFSTRHYRVRSITRTFMNDEKQGNYGSSWDLLHSYMKKDFPQSDYEKMRSQLFLNDFKATSISYRILHIKHLSSWSPTTSAPKFNDVYKVTLSETFDSQFGEERLQSLLYLARDSKNDERWRILWKLGS